MPSLDVTAQAFRKAAARVDHPDERWVKILLLAAAEHCDQLDATNAQLDTYMAENEALHEQITTLTASLIQVKQKKDERIVELIQQKEVLRSKVAAAKTWASGFVGYAGTHPAISHSFTRLWDILHQGDPE